MGDELADRHGGIGGVDGVVGGDGLEGQGGLVHRGLEFGLVG